MIPIAPYMPGIPAAPLGAPVGTIIAFAGEVGSPAAPGVTDVGAWGWMVCNGRQLDIGDYPELYAALGFRYIQPGESSNPDSATQFRIPNYEGYFLRGVWPSTDGSNPYPGSSGPADPDASERVMANGDKLAEVGSLQLYAFQSHEHKYHAAVIGLAAPDDEDVAAIIGKPKDTEGDPQPDGNSQTLQFSANETRSRNAYVYYLIKYTMNITVWGAYLPALPQPG